eukprot:TRINITY_DN8365_c0_g4_i1.p1 TRINITY_DN8365_c0_g4~~TRINITY_DN8365_c0_g4_i1.p1  ORF type:complete len:476 (+),score=52.97 TRINITY_DN8365_c0_g4_i1:66-1430(+)
MSGWLIFQVKQGRDIKCNSTEVEVSYSWTPKIFNKRPGRGNVPEYGLKHILQVKDPNGEATIKVEEKSIVGVNLVKAATGTATIAIEKGVGEEWVELSHGQGSVLVEWRYTHFAYASLFAEVDEDETPPPPQPYSLATLQAEIMRVSNHGYNMLLPYWWLSDRWFWVVPLESAMVMTLGSLAFYHDMANAAIPAALLCIMLVNFVKKFRGLEKPPQAEALGFIKTLNWYNDILRLTQNSLASTCDTFDGMAEMFTWENQDMSRTILISCIAALLASWFGFLRWTYIFMIVWIYLFTYYPLASIAPQMYKSLLPSTWVAYLTKGKDETGVVESEGLSGSVVVGVLPIGKMTIPSQEKKADGKTYYEICLSLTNGGVDKSVWYRYSDFALLRDKLGKIDHTMAVKTFPGKTAFAVKGEALNARRRDLEAWLDAVIAKSKTSRGAAWRRDLKIFLLP